MCFNADIDKKLNCSSNLFGPCDEALLKVKSFSLTTQCKRNRSNRLFAGLNHVLGYHIAMHCWWASKPASRSLWWSTQAKRTLTFWSKTSQNICCLRTQNEIYPPDLPLLWEEKPSESPNIRQDMAASLGPSDGEFLCLQSYFNLINVTSFDTENYFTTVAHNCHGKTKSHGKTKKTSWSAVVICI